MSRSDTRVPYPLGVSQSITTSGTTARTSAGVGTFTRHVMIYSSQDAYYNFGDSTVTATTSDTFIPAGGEHFVQIRGGQYIAAIQDSAAGVVKVSEFGY